MNKNDFLHTVCVVDTETTNVDPTQAQIAEMAVAHWGQSWSVTSQLYGVEGGMPPEASAKNQISNRMIADLPTFLDSVEQAVEMMDLNKSYWVAHNAEYDRTVLVSSWATSQPELAELVGDKTRWICTWRLSKHAYQHQFTDQLYGQNYLRYRLDLPVDDTVGVHRAGADVEVCGALLERLIDDLAAQGKIDIKNDLGPQLVLLCQTPVVIRNWPFGKHKGTPISSLTTDYLLWAIDNIPGLNSSSPDIDLVETVRSELESRLA